MILGAHQSIAGGLARAFERAEADGAQAMQIFTRNARGWVAKPITADDAVQFRAEAARTGIAAVAHCSYLVNLGAEDPTVREKSLAAFTDELLRCEALGIGALVVHPGSHRDEQQGIALIAEALDACLAAAGDARTRVLLETTAGQGFSLGHDFGQLARIIERVRWPERIGICLDTCHLFAAGHDLGSARGWRDTLKQIDTTLGCERVEAIHLNDSKKPLGSRVDRHEEIGEGALGLEAFRPLMNEPRFAATLGILETPEPTRFRANLERLRSLIGRRVA